MAKAMERHLQDFLTKNMIYVLLADSLHCVLGLHAFMKNAAMFGGPCSRELRMATGQHQPGAEVFSSIGHKGLDLAHKPMSSEANPFLVKCETKCSDVSLMRDLKAEDLVKPCLETQKL